MLTPTSVADQLAAVHDDRLRVLVVGAGMAGVTLTQLLRARGHHPVLLERSSPGTDAGYMLGMLPLIDPVIDTLGLRESYQAHSVRLARYRIRGRSGRVIREYPLGAILEPVGEYRGLDRGSMLEVLGTHDLPVSHDAIVEGLHQEGDVVRAYIGSGRTRTAAEFDLVVAADGLHSTTRTLVLGPAQVTTFETGWGGWVTWADADGDTDLYEEGWGAGRFVGTYPVRGRIGVFVGGAQDDTAVGRQQFVRRVGREFRELDDRMHRALTSIAGSEEAYYWALSDCRCATWSVGRVVMLGDAAAGFLPTAGIGAGMAMESAWVLAGRLAEANPVDLPGVLREYERTQRPRVEAAQDNSRQLARMLFHRSRGLASARDAVTRVLPLSLAFRPVKRLLEAPPDRTTG